MRPRVFPAEDAAVAASVASHAEASMRPRVFPAEDWGIGARVSVCESRFNEAAGIPRGRRAELHCAEWAVLSGFNEAAGIPRGRQLVRAELAKEEECFNEAAGIPRGRPTRARGPSQRPACFNEAAGIPRGRHRRVEIAIHAIAASMRPRVFPAEDVAIWNAGDCYTLPLQ